MTARIRLIGVPALDMNGDRRELAGRKPWALLAYLVLGHRATRRELAEMLWPDADDPLAAERWALLQVRRAIAEAGQVVEDERRLSFMAASGTEIDALLVLSGMTDPSAFEWIGNGELLEGFTFDDTPAFDQWIALERQRVASATLDALRHAVSVLARSEPRRAIVLAERALAIEPFDDSFHELLIDIRVVSGDRAGARAYVEALERRYRSELGIALPERIRRPLDRPAPATANPLVDLRHSAGALLELARSRLEAGDYAGAIEAGRRASYDSAASGDPAVECSALSTLGSVLIHSVRARDDEAVALLGRALRLALETGDTAARAEIERELGYVAFLAAHYGAAEAALRRSLRLATDAGDEGAAGRALALIGACESDRAEFDASLASLDAAIAYLGRAGDRRWIAYALSFLARAQLRRGDLALARVTGARSVRAARDAGWSSLVPWCLAQEAEAALAAGDATHAKETFGRAFALGCEIADPCWEGISLRGLALVEARGGRDAEALSMLGEAYERCTRAADTYKWTEALLLTDMVLLEEGQDAGRLAAAVEVTRRGPMPDLYGRLIPFVRQTRLQTEAS